MVHMNNIFAGIFTFIIVGAIEYLIYPTTTSIVGSLSADIQVFASVVHLGIFILGLLGLPMLMIIQSEAQAV